MEAWNRDSGWPKEEVSDLVIVAQYAIHRSYEFHFSD